MVELSLVFRRGGKDLSLVVIVKVSSSLTGLALIYDFVIFENL